MIDNYIIYNHLPSIDLHGLDRVEASIKTNDFIYENYILGNCLIYIIHGKGKYILKNEIHKILAKNKYVEEYKLDIFNTGNTIIELKKRN